ncbi:MAG: hypothetical protein D6781_03710 [Verrucomicrobia bacterium]|nr:MAG: hypothetical protein D6781_03710 [Verrucomicrobiota bacterium]
MKHAAAFGGFGGFLLAALVGTLADRDPGLVFLDASIAAFVGASLMRWLNRVLLRNLHAALMEKQRASKEQEEGQPAGNTQTLNT